MKVSIADLNQVANRILMDVGVPAADARLVVETLQEAELCGTASHGYMRLLSYVNRIKAGLMEPAAQVKLERDAASILRVDGGNGLGQVVAMRTVEKAVEIARETGCCMAAIRNTNHFGTCGFYGRKAAKMGTAAFVTSNAAASMAPFGGMDNMFGTNPIAFSFPAGKYDNFTIDMALTTVARGKIRLCDREDKEIPLGWAMDENGVDTTNPAAALRGSLLPMGGHKGYGMAMVVDMLCGILASANLSFQIESMFQSTRPADLGQFITVIDIAKLLPLSEFNARVEEWFEEIKRVRLRQGFREILIPGELENRRLDQQPQEIELADKTARELLGGS